MAELVRWSSEDGRAPEGVRELLEAAAPVKPMPLQTHTQTLARVTELATAKSLPALSLVGGKALTTTLLGGAVCASLAVGVAQWEPQSGVSPAAVPAARTVPPAGSSVPVLQREGSVDLGRERAPLPAVTTTREAPSAALEADQQQLGRTRRSASERAAQPASADRLAAETRLLERARRSLPQDPALALELSRQYSERFPKGQLRFANQCVAVEALQRLGRSYEARVRAWVLLDTQPEGLYAERARELLGIE